MKKSHCFALLFLVIPILFTGCRQDRAEKNIHPAVSTSPLKSEYKTMLGEYSFDLDGDDNEEKISLYTAAERDKDGQMMWDDGQNWLLFVQDEEAYYPLFEQYVQLGETYFTVSEKPDEMPLIAVVTVTNFNLSVINYRYDTVQHAYVEEAAFNTQSHILRYSTIPHY